MPLLLLLGLAFLALAVYLVGEVATSPARERRGSLKRAATYGDARMSSPGMREESFGERVIAPMRMTLAHTVLRVNKRTTVGKVSTKLMGAGLGRAISPQTFLATKALAACGAFVGGAFLGAIGGKGGAMAALLAFVFAGLGFLVPDIVVSFKGRSRREKIRSELPDALDLLAVSVEAGMGFDGALQKLTEHMEGPLIEEFGLALGEMRIGESRRNALQKMAARVDTPEIASFIRAIIQADELGISLGRILKVQAADTRNKRQAAAEEKAMKAPIKMLFPTALFIFPAMFIVILGPALLDLGKVF
jgi:tight adherence protein C